MMTDNDRQTCEQLIADRMRDRLGDLLRDWSAMTQPELIQFAAELDVDTDGRETGDIEHEAQSAHGDRCHDEILSVQKITTYDVCLSWGGPSDGFKLHHDGDGWTGGEYYYRDWFDGARRDIDADTAAALAELWAIGPDYE